jgi:hypothetical protein
MTGRRVEILIEELVLHGFASADRHVIGEALAHELERLVAAENPAGLAAIGSVRELQAGPADLSPGARPGAVGARLARAVHASFSARGQGGSK